MANETNKQVVHENVEDGSNMIGFPFVIADSEQDMPEIKSKPIGWHTSALTSELQEVREMFPTILDPKRAIYMVIWLY